MRRRKNAETAQPTESARPGRITPDPLRQMPCPPSYVYRAGQKRRTPPVPRLRPGEAEAFASAEHARRQVEEQAERARIAAELKAEKATRSTR